MNAARSLLQQEFQHCCRYHFDHTDVLVGYTPCTGRPSCTDETAAE